MLSSRVLPVESRDKISERRNINYICILQDYFSEEICKQIQTIFSNPRKNRLKATIWSLFSKIIVAALIQAAFVPLNL